MRFQRIEASLEDTDDSRTEDRGRRLLESGYGLLAEALEQTGDAEGAAEARTKAAKLNSRGR